MSNFKLKTLEGSCIDPVNNLKYLGILPTFTMETAAEKQAFCLFDVYKKKSSNIFFKLI